MSTTKHLTEKWELPEIGNILNKMGRSLREFPPILLPSSPSDNSITNRLIVKEHDYSPLLYYRNFNHYIELNAEEESVFTAIIESHEKKVGGLFFVYGKFFAAIILPGGRTTYS